MYVYRAALRHGQRFAVVTTTRSRLRDRAAAHVCAAPLALFNESSSRRGHAEETVTGKILTGAASGQLNRASDLALSWHLQEHSAFFTLDGDGTAGIGVRGVRIGSA